MKVACVGFALLLGFSLSGVSQEIDVGDYGGAYGYTTIDYDIDSGQVTAYSETDMDDDLQTYYEPTLGFSVYDQNNAFITGGWQPGCTKYYDGVTFSWSCQFAAGSGETYTAWGYHGVELQQQYDCEDDSCDDPEYIDYLEFSELEQFDLIDLGTLDFFGPGSSTPIDTSDVDLGTTYDNASVSIPAGCGDVRDQVIREYYSLSTYKPQCVDFIDPATWNYYYTYLVNSYFGFSDLTGDQSTGSG